MIGDFVLVFLLAGGGLLALFLKSARKDRDDNMRKSAQAVSEASVALEEARKYQPGARLLCLGCETRFSGPLTEAGCPHCHLVSLVVTESKERP